MGWKNLFKAKAPRIKPDPRVRWFGKLPTYADYYTSPTDEDWAVEYNEWILKGCELYFSRQRERGGELRVPSAACLLRLPRSQVTVLSSFQDYGGDMRGRPFPLSFYLGMPSEGWPGPTSETVLPALRVLHALTELREEVSRFFNSPGRFEDTFGGRELDLSGLGGEIRDGSWRAPAQALALAAWFRGAQPCVQPATVDAWCRQVAAWGQNIRTLEADDFAPTLRFPLVMSVPFEVQVPGWLHWLGQRMALGRRYVSLLLAKDANGATGRLTVVARDEVLPEDFLLMTGLADKVPYADDLCALGSDGADDPGESGIAPDTWLGFVESQVKT
jgi:hypothetical protein